MCSALFAPSALTEEIQSLISNFDYLSDNSVIDGKNQVRIQLPIVWEERSNHYVFQAESFDPSIEQDDNDYTTTSIKGNTHDKDFYHLCVENLKHKWNINNKNFQDVDVLSCFHAQNRRGRATMLLNILVKMVLQFRWNFESTIQVKKISQFHVELNYYPSSDYFFIHTIGGIIQNLHPSTTAFTNNGSTMSGPSWLCAFSPDV